MTHPLLRPALLLALVAVAAPASAQTVVSVHAGGAEFDLSGTGSAFVSDVRVQRPITRSLAIEGGVGLSQTAQQFGDVTYLLPSAELQIGLPLAERVRPFVGLGFGALVPLNDPGPVTRVIGGSEVTADYDPETEPTVTASIGLDASVTDRVVVRAAGRLRGTLGSGTDFFLGTFSEVTAGLGYRF